MTSTVGSASVAWRTFAAASARHRFVFSFAGAFGPVAVDCTVR